MADLNDLPLNDDPVSDVAVDALPEERGVRIPLLQPGKGIVFQLPSSFDFSVDAIPDQGQRLRVNFKDATTLRVYPAGTPVRTSVSNIERTIKQRGSDEQIKVNELLYLLRNGLGYTGPLTNNKQYGAAIQTFANAYFAADWSWSAKCSDKKEIFKDGAKVEGKFGCGQLYDLKSRTYKNRDGVVVTVLAIPRDASGAYSEQVVCKCGANLFVNGNLSNFAPVKTEE